MGAFADKRLRRALGVIAATVQPSNLSLSSCSRVARHMRLARSGRQPQQRIVLVYLRSAKADPEQPASLINLLPFAAKVLGDAHL